MSTTRNHHAFTRAFAWGALCGVRSMLAPVILSHKLLAVSAPSRVQRALAATTTRGSLGTLAALELFADKTPFVPARVAPVALLGRAVNGALLGLASATPLSPIERASATPPKESKALRLATLAALGAGAAIGTAFLSYHARRAATDRFRLSNATAGFLEDGMAIALAMALPSVHAVTPVSSPLSRNRSSPNSVTSSNPM